MASRRLHPEWPGRCAPPRNLDDGLPGTRVWDGCRSPCRVGDPDRRPARVQGKRPPRWGGGHRGGVVTDGPPDRRPGKHRVTGPVKPAELVVIRNEVAVAIQRVEVPASSPARDAGRVLTVVEGLAIGGGDLTGGRPLGLGEDLLLDLEIGLGVVVVELGERVGTVRRGRRALPSRRPCSRPSAAMQGQTWVRSCSSSRAVPGAPRRPSPGIVAPGEGVRLPRRSGRRSPPVGEDRHGGRKREGPLPARQSAAERADPGEAPRPRPARRCRAEANSARVAGTPGAPPRLRGKGGALSGSD